MPPLESAFTYLEPVAEGSVQPPRIRRGQPHSQEFKNCVSQRYGACADKYDIKTLTRCLMTGVKSSEECKETFDAYNACLSEAFKSCLDEFIW